MAVSAHVVDRVTVIPLSDPAVRNAKPTTGPTKLSDEKEWIGSGNNSSGEDFSHRHQWIVDRIAFLTQVFAIDVCAYAIMSNHYHVVVRVSADNATLWTHEDIMRRWKLMFGLPPLVERYKKPRRNATLCARINAVLFQPIRHQSCCDWALIPNDLLPT